ncbi:hypothetical protein PMG11_01093 [Penicillium brasilianum]|uniref:Myb-like domain-containing protein n=1 Tax=Penicillium brasilianum TaxID=104259 RepID=A0A0F7TE47_PENBI|nr:hypothetical protein PMG11_01093 [Penicillium brasilianum]
MSNSSDTPWTEEEKNTLLSEILKKAGIPSSYLLRIINEFRISPDWEHIPLPQGRSLSQCRLAFENMQLQLKSQTPSQPHPQAQAQSQSPFQSHSQQPQAQAPAPAPAQAQHHHQHQHQYQHPPHPPPPTAPPTIVPSSRLEAPGTPSSIDANLRKRPLYPAEKPLAPRAIQPRPPASTASYSSESSAQLSPRLDTTSTGEPPRKRGRPSKAETERRKAAAEARGETYPPPRRANPNRMKIPPSPTSPAGPPIAAFSTPKAPGPATIPHPVHGPNAGLIPYDVPGPRPLAPASSIPGRSSTPSSNPNPSERRDIPTRSMGPNMRELPRPTEMGHPLPSPHALQLGTLQLGPPDPFPRLNSNPGERSAYGAIPPDRFSPPDSGRRDSAASRGEREREREELASYAEARSSTTPGEKPLR